MQFQESATLDKLRGYLQKSYLRDENNGQFTLYVPPTTIFSINSTGKEILEKIKNGNQLHEISSYLQKKYPNNETNKTIEDVNEFVSLLENIFYNSIMFIEDHLSFLAGHFTKFPLRSPTSVTIELTSACNLHCKHCYVNSMPISEQNKDLSTQEWTNILDTLKKNDVMAITFSGGEPFIRSDIVDLIQYACRKGFTVSVSTNATMLDDEIVNKLSSIDFEGVQTSLDGGKNTNDYLRGAGSFDKTINSIKKLRKAGIETTIHCVLMSINLNELKELFELAKKLSVSLVFSRFIPVGRGEDMPQFHVEDPFLYKNLIKNAEDMGLKYNSPELDMNTLLSYCKKIAPKITCNILPDGCITPCAFLRDPKFGNILRDDFSEIWKNIQGYHTEIEKACEKSCLRTCFF